MTRPPKCGEVDHQGSESDCVWDDTDPDDEQEIVKNAELVCGSDPMLDRAQESGCDASRCGPLVDFFGCHQVIVGVGRKFQKD